MDSSVLFLIILVAVVGVLVYFRHQARAQRERVEQERLSLIETTFHHIANLATRNIQVKFVAGDATPNIALRDGERALCVFPDTTLQVPRAVRRSRSVYGGPSIRIAKGLWWRFGESRGVSESHDELRAIDVGTLLLTNQRIVFVGSQRTSSVPLEKVINIEGYSDGLVVHREGKEKIESYLLSDMQMNYQYDGQTLSAPVDGRLVKAAIDEAVLVGQDADSTAAAAIADGDALVEQGNFEEAMKLYCDSLAIRERLAKADPANIDRQRGLWVAYDRIGDLLREQGNLGEALKSCRDGLAIAESLAKADPGNRAPQRDLFVSYEHVGDVLKAQGNLDEALKLYRDGLAIAGRLAKSDDPRNTQSQDLQIAVSKIGGLAWRFVLARKFSQAIDATAQAISAAPDLTWLYANRGYALMFQGEVDEARAIYLRYRRHQKIQGEKSWKAVVLDDFMELRKAGLNHPLMDEIERAFSANV